MESESGAWTALSNLCWTLPGPAVCRAVDLAGVVSHALSPGGSAEMVPGRAGELKMAEFPPALGEPNG